MDIEWSTVAYKDYMHWRATNKKVSAKINRFLNEIIEAGPLSGTGKPEKLSGDLKGTYSKRITEADRLVYKIENHTLLILSCKNHY